MLPILSLKKDLVYSEQNRLNGKRVIHRSTAKVKNKQALFFFFFKCLNTVVPMLVNCYSNSLQNNGLVSFFVNHRHQSLPSMVACLINL